LYFVLLFTFYIKIYYIFDPLYHGSPVCSTFHRGKITHWSRQFFVCFVRKFAGKRIKWTKNCPGRWAYLSSDQWRSQGGWVDFHPPFRQKLFKKPKPKNYLKLLGFLNWEKKFPPPQKISGHCLWLSLSLLPELEVYSDFV